MILILFLFIKSTICDVRHLTGGYIYPQPFPPVQFDEPSTPSPIYLPPQEPLPSPNPTYLPPYPPTNEDSIIIPSPPSLYQSPPQVKIINMSCDLDHSFRTFFQINPLTSPPVTEDSLEDCISPTSFNSYKIEMIGKRMFSCGVRRCQHEGKINMCLTLRIPTIRSLKLPEDHLMTLQCLPQENTASLTKHLKLSSGNVLSRARASGVVAAGGSQRSFDGKVQVLRKGVGGNFDVVVQPGSTVSLGEELLLKASVQEGDGWRYSRMGSVIVRSPATQKSIILVDENGCRNVNMKTICPHNPRQLSALVNALNFRAFLFQGTSKGDDMLLSVRMFACVHPQDCLHGIGCEAASLRNNLRLKRQTSANITSSKKELEVESEFVFKVLVGPVSAAEEQSITRSFLIDGFIVSLGSAFLISLSLLFYVWIKFVRN